MSSLLLDGPTLARAQQEREADAAPASWERWARSSGTYAEHMSSTPPDWTLHERPARAAAPVSTHRPRGNQDYSTLHLGKGTRWLKTGTR